MLCSRKQMLIVMLVLSASPLTQAKTDPTRPPVFLNKVAQPKAQPLKLTMILNQTDQRRAIINETVVSESDTINGAKVLIIKENSVLLLRAGKQWLLTMPHSDVRQGWMDD